MVRTPAHPVAMARTGVHAPGPVAGRAVYVNCKPATVAAPPWMAKQTNKSTQPLSGAGVACHVRAHTVHTTHDTRHTTQQQRLRASRRVNTTGQHQEQHRGTRGIQRARISLQRMQAHAWCTGPCCQVGICRTSAVHLDVVALSHMQARPESKPSCANKVLTFLKLAHLQRTHTCLGAVSFMRP